VNGRKVIDGRGIIPDITIDELKYSRLTATLVASNIIFNYATEFVRTHPTIGDARNFKLTNEEYAAFKAYVLKQEFTYSTASEEQLEKMKATAEKEGFYEDMKAEYEALLTRVTPSKERDLEKFRDEIMDILANEIVSRYFYQNGRAEQAFQQDKDVTRALEILRDRKAYNTILGY
jgi:carboxyl-terminal processing protease